MTRVTRIFAFQVAQPSFYACFVGGVSFVFWRTALGTSRLSPLIAANLIGTLPPALLLLIGPYNPFHGMGSGHGNIKRVVRVSDLDADERRLLTYCYLPENRRRAFMAALGNGLLLSGLWWIFQILKHSSRVPDRPYDAGVVMTVMMLWTSIAAGMCALLYPAYRKPTLITEQVSWPKDVEYPGPLRTAFRAGITGKMPEFLLHTGRIPATGEESKGTN